MEFKQCAPPHSIYEISKFGCLRRKTRKGYRYFLPWRNVGVNSYYSIKKDNGSHHAVNVNSLMAAAWPERSFEARRGWLEETRIEVRNLNNKCVTPQEGTVLNEYDPEMTIDWRNANHCPMG